MSEPTKLRLARVLREAGLESMAAAAERGRYDDYQSESATPCVDLVNHLKAAGAHELARRAMDGEWDATREESDAWAASPDGQAAFAELIGAQQERVAAAEEKRRRRAEKLRAQHPPPPKGPAEAPGERWSVSVPERALLEELARKVGNLIGSVVEGGRLEGKVGFCVTIYTYAPGFITWLSNGDRPSTIKALRELADAMEKGRDEGPIRRPPGGTDG